MKNSELYTLSTIKVELFPYVFSTSEGVITIPDAETLKIVSKMCKDLLHKQEIINKNTPPETILPFRNRR